MKMKKMGWLFLCYLSIIQLGLTQNKDVLMTNIQQIEDNTYQDVKGSPYYFTEWQLGKIYPVNDMDPIQEVLLNFNGYTQNFEIKKENYYTALDEKWYNSIEIEQGDNTIIYKKGLLPKDPNSFSRLIYQGNDFSIVYDFKVTLSTREQLLQSRLKEVKEFNRRPHYYLVKDGKAQVFKLKKRSILSLFSTYSTKIENYAKKHHLKFSKESDLIKLFTIYNSLKGNQNNSILGER